MSKAYLFDLDGTLVDTSKSNAWAYRAAAKEVLGVSNIGIERFLKAVRSGRSYRIFIPEIIDGVDAEQLVSVGEKKAELYPDYLHLSVANLELVSAARCWKQEGALNVLVTAARKCNAEKVLEYHKLLDLFDECVFGDEIENLKPDPEIYLKALEVTGVDVRNCVAFEDSEVGIAAACAAGLEVVRVDWCS